MSKLKGLLLTEGFHGMISQVEGLAKTLDLDFIREKIELNNFWKLFPPKITPVKNFVFKNKLDDKFNIVISCGRKSVIPSLYLKNKYKSKIINIHIQDPKVSLSNFDFIIVPEHDSLFGENVVTSKGAIHYLTNDELIENENYLKPRIDPQKKIVSFIIGGPNKYYNFSNEELTKIFNKVRSNFISIGYKIIIIPSMRTPKRIIDLANKEFFSDGYVVNSVDRQAYLASLALANKIVVTCDSTSMISEAAASGKPIFVAHMQPKMNNYRFERFFHLFREMGITRNFEEKVENWSYKHFNEAERIAPIIHSKLSN